jgi:hypothetical protein
MKVIYTGGSITNCGTVLDVPSNSNAHIEFNGTHMANNGVFLHQRDPVSLMQTIGLPKDADVKDLIDCLKALEAIPKGDTVRQMNAIKGSSLWGCIGNAANITTIFSNLVAIANSDAITKILASF